MALSVAYPSSLDAGNFNSYGSFGLIEMSGTAQTSPTPSVSSDSSGIGSLKSDRESVNSDSLPSSPQTNEKKFYKPSDLAPPNDAKVMYQGRDLLDLWGNVRDPQWQFRPAYLPTNSPALFFANRSQYHRLSAIGMTVQFIHNRCADCGFTCVEHVIEGEM